MCSIALMRRHRPRLWGSCRLNLALMCLAATFAFFLMRLNLSFAIVCMVRQVRYPTNATNGISDHSANSTDIGPSFRDDIITPLVSVSDNPLASFSTQHKDSFNDVDDLHISDQVRVPRLELIASLYAIYFISLLSRQFFFCIIRLSRLNIYIYIYSTLIHLYNTYL